MKGDFVDYFELLQIHYLASDIMIKNSYHKLSQIYHPDNNSKSNCMGLINEAYSVLANPRKKEEYINDWINYYSNLDILKGYELKRSMYDFSVQPLRRLVLEYMFFIKNKNLDMAYTMLSNYNQERIFKQDFILWQNLISEVHELIDFDCTLAGFDTNYNSNDNVLKKRNVVKFRVKIVEKNKLLDRIEQDFFIRKLIYENSKWKILIENSSVKAFIKKYRKIISINKKNHKEINKYFSKTEHDYRTGFVLKTSFLNNCEYEQIRFLRYKNIFSIIKIKVDFNNVDKRTRQKYIGDIGDSLVKHSRKLDSFCYLKKGVVLILLPETNQSNAEKTSEKMLKIIENYKNENMHDNKSINISFKCIEQKFESVKELISEVLRD